MGSTFGNIRYTRRRHRERLEELFTALESRLKQAEFHYSNIKTDLDACYSVWVFLAEAERITGEILYVSKMLGAEFTSERSARWHELHTRMEAMQDNFVAKCIRQRAR